jgi:hypothetical protein
VRGLDNLIPLKLISTYLQNLIFIQQVKKDTFDPLEEHRYWCPWIIELPEGITCSPKKISEMTEGGEKKASYPWEHVLQIICPSFFDVSHEDSVSEHFKQVSSRL